VILPVNRPGHDQRWRVFHERQAPAYTKPRYLIRCNCRRAGKLCDLDLLWWVDQNDIRVFMNAIEDDSSSIRRDIKAHGRAMP